MKLLRQSTAVTRLFGPFKDATDGITLETGLVAALDHATTGIKISKNGGALAVRNSAGSPTGPSFASVYDSNGMYRVTFDIVDTNTLGEFTATHEDSTVHCGVWDKWTVVPANIYDALVSGTDMQKVDAVEVDSDVNAAVAAKHLARSTIYGTVAAGSTTTSIKIATLNVRVGAADQFKGLIFKIQPGAAAAALEGQGTDITASSIAGSPEVVTLTVTALTTAPSAGDLFTIS